MSRAYIFHPAINPASAITASRLGFLPIFFWALANDRVPWAVFAVVTSTAFDLLDGLVARKLQCATPFGEILDSVTDSFSLGACMGMLIYFDRLSGAFGIAVASLLVLNGVGRYIYSRRLGRTTNYRSFAAERLVGYAEFLVCAAAGRVNTAWFAWSFIALFAFTVAHDLRRMIIDPVPGPMPGGAP